MASEREEAFRNDAIRTVSRPRWQGNGVCRWCGCEIDEYRLQALPNAAHCAECAAEIEEARLKNQRRGF